MAAVHIISWEFCSGTLQTALCSIQLAEGRQRAFFNLDLPIKYAPRSKIIKLHVLNGDISSQQITCGLTFLKGHVRHRSRGSTRRASLPCFKKVWAQIQGWWSWLFCAGILNDDVRVVVRVLHWQQRCHFDHDPLGRRLLGMQMEVHTDGGPRCLVWVTGGCSSGLWLEKLGSQTQASSRFCPNYQSASDFVFRLLKEIDLMNSREQLCL